MESSHATRNGSTRYHASTSLVVHAALREGTVGWVRNVLDLIWDDEVDCGDA
jgi:hypothetical protein